MKDKDKPMKGCVYVSKDESRLVVGEYFPRIGMDGSVKSEGRDIIPSPYTTGLLDKFLDGTFTPAFETARGCPFLCSFCHQGIDASKITTFSVKRMAEEFENFGKKQITGDPPPGPRRSRPSLILLFWVVLGPQGARWAQLCNLVM